jgi:hypothetical protein
MSRRAPFGGASTDYEGAVPIFMVGADPSATMVEPLPSEIRTQTAKKPSQGLASKTFELA